VKIDWLYATKSNGYSYENDNGFSQLENSLDLDFSQTSKTIESSLTSPTTNGIPQLNLFDSKEEPEEDEGNDLFEDCCFRIENFSKEETSEIVHSNYFNLQDIMLSRMGGSRTPFFTQSKSPYVLINATSLSNSDAEKYSNENHNVKIGNLQWLKECYSKKKIVPMEDFLKSIFYFI
jgi:hypothetical protein